jgi:hypothetical protein
VASFGGAGAAPPTTRRPPQRDQRQDLALQVASPRREAASFKVCNAMDKTRNAMDKARNGTRDGCNAMDKERHETGPGLPLHRRRCGR